MGTSARRLRVPVAERLVDQIMGRSRDVHGKLKLNSTQKYIKLTLKGYSTIVNDSGKKLS